MTSEKKRIYNIFYETVSVIDFYFFKKNLNQDLGTSIFHDSFLTRSLMEKFLKGIGNCSINTWVHNPNE